MAKTTKTKNFKKAALVAKYFGFDSETKFNVENDTIKLCAGIKKEKKYLDEYLPAMEEVAQLILNFTAKDSTASVFKYFDQPASGDHNQSRKRTGMDQMSLHVVGVENSIADGLMIKTIKTILEDHGHKNLVLHLNNVGGKETQTQFNREATNFFRKHIAMLTPVCRQYFKEGIHSLVVNGGEDCKILKEHAPEPMDYLSDEGRVKFRELIEYIESFDLPYEIDSYILGDPNYSTHTVFQIIDGDSGKVLAAGTRYDLLSKKLGTRKDVCAISANVWVEESKPITEKALKKSDENKFFMIQVGTRAKILALDLIERLYKDKIYVKHRIARDKLASQLQLAGKLNSEYYIIIGHKEALDKSAIIKDAQGKAQRNVPLDEITKYIQELK